MARVRAALIAAAADSDGITPLEVMQEFPLELIYKLKVKQLVV